MLNVKSERVTEVTFTCLVRLKLTLQRLKWNRRVLCLCPALFISAVSQWKVSLQSVLFIFIINYFLVSLQRTEINTSSSVTCSMTCCQSPGLTSLMCFWVHLTLKVSIPVQLPVSPCDLMFTVWVPLKRVNVNMKRTRDKSYTVKKHSDNRRDRRRSNDMKIQFQTVWNKEMNRALQQTSLCQMYRWENRWISASRLQFSVFLAVLIILRFKYQLFTMATETQQSPEQRSNSHAGRAACTPPPPPSLCSHSAHPELSINCTIARTHTHTHTHTHSRRYGFHM